MGIRNWKYYQPDCRIGKLKITQGQFMTGNILGIIAEEKSIIEPDRNVMNAKSYPFPVRFKLVEKIENNNHEKVAEQIRKQITSLEQEGCRAILTTGGRFGLFDDVFHESELMALSTPLSFLDFILTSISSTAQVGIVNDLEEQTNIEVLKKLGFSISEINRCIFFGESSLSSLASCNKESIGAILWDNKENYKLYLNNIKVPVYDILKISSLLFNAVCQIPYEGVI